MVNVKMFINDEGKPRAFELQAIEEQLEREKGLIDQYGEMMKMCKDRILLGKYELYQSAHRRHYEALYDILKRGSAI